MLLSSSTVNSSLPSTPSNMRLQSWFTFDFTAIRIHPSASSISRLHYQIETLGMPQHVARICGGAISPCPMSSSGNPQNWNLTAPNAAPKPLSFYIKTLGHEYGNGTRRRQPEKTPKNHSPHDFEHQEIVTFHRDPMAGQPCVIRHPRSTAYQQHRKSNKPKPAALLHLFTCPILADTRN